MILPRILRVLIIDDKAGKGALAETVRNVIFAITKISEKGRHLDYVDIRCCDDVEVGVTLWQNQAFNLTLVDSDFREKKKNEKKYAVSSLFDIHAQYKGVFAFQLLKLLLSGTYDYRNPIYGIHLWSALEQGDLDKLLKAAGMIPEGDKWYIPKHIGTNAKKPFDSLREAISEVVDGATGRLAPKLLAEQFITLYKIKAILPHEILSTCPFIDGYLIHKAQPITYLDSLNLMGEDKDTRLYFTLRKPGKLNDNDDFECGQDFFSVYLGPASRDVDKPLAALIEWLFKGWSPTEQDVRPLSTNEQQSLQYRTAPRGDRRHPDINTPAIQKNEAGRKQNRSDHSIIAAATPLTGVSTVGFNDAQTIFRKKIKALLLGPFDKVVLKTCYRDQPKPGNAIRWPALQAQSHHRTRCYRSAGHPRTLWNTGSTALEMFDPEMLNKFLSSCKNDNTDNIFGKDCERIIVSLGSKYPEHTSDDIPRYHGRTIADQQRVFKGDLCDNIWKPLFDAVFNGLDNKDFPTVEINVRHYLRGNSAFNLKGDEYLTLSGLNRDVRVFQLNRALREFRWWLEVLQSISTTAKKRLILKFPYRTDLLAFIKSVMDFCANESNRANGFGIQGISLINAYKSGVCESNKGLNFTPAWYSRLKSWPDAIGRETKYQMSGEMLNASRNQLIHLILQGRKEMKLQGFELHFGGGIVGQPDLTFCQNPHGSLSKTDGSRISVQIGTWALLNLDLGKTALPDSCEADPPSSGGIKPKVTNSCRDRKCKSSCVMYRCPSNAISFENEFHIDYKRCCGCEICLTCHSGNFLPEKNGQTLSIPDYRLVKSVPTKSTAILPRFSYLLHELCTGCGKCSRSFYCDAFLDRRGMRLHPLMDPRNCTGCGLCAQICPEGALQLFMPNHMCILISRRGERSDSLKALQIPHFTYDPIDDLALLRPANAEDDEQHVKEARDLIKSGGFDESTLHEWAKRLWKFRLENDRIPEAILKDKKDNRCEFLNHGTIAGMLKDLRKAVSRIGPKMATMATRAFIWSQLIWSDPGQALLTSPIILVRIETEALSPEEQLPTTSENVERALTSLKSKTFILTYRWIVLDHHEDGRIPDNNYGFGTIPDDKDDPGKHALKLNMEKDAITNYARAGLGQHRLLGLDIRACPHMLKVSSADGDRDLTPEEILQVAGLPWNALMAVPSLKTIHDEVAVRLGFLKKLRIQ